MFSKSLKIKRPLFATFIALMLAVVNTAHAVVDNTVQRVVVAAQTVALDGKSQITITVNSMVGAPASGAVPSAYQSKYTGPLAASVAIPSSAAPGPFANDDQAIDWVKNDAAPVGGLSPTAAMASLEQIARKSDANTIVFTYTRDVEVINAAGEPEKRTIGATWIKTVGGAANTDGFSISPSTVIGILYVKYNQKQVYEKLPPEWAPPDGGRITYQKFVLDLANANGGFTPVGSPVVVDVNGAYDEPPESSVAGQGSDAAGGIDTGLHKLAYQWIPPKLAQLNVNFALIDYGRTIEPVWDTDANGDLVARISVNVLERKVEYGCSTKTVTYFNRGVIGAELNEGRDYYLLSGGKLSNLGHKDFPRVAPGKDYAWTIDYNTGIQDHARFATMMAKRIINPFATKKTEAVVYEYDNDTVNGLPASRYVHIAAIDYRSSVSNNKWMFQGNVPGLGQVCADTKTGDMWINGVKQRWYKVPFAVLPAGYTNRPLKTTYNKIFGYVIGSNSPYQVLRVAPRWYPKVKTESVPLTWQEESQYLNGSYTPPAGWNVTRKCYGLFAEYCKYYRTRTTLEESNSNFHFLINGRIWGVPYCIRWETDYDGNGYCAQHIKYHGPYRMAYEIRPPGNRIKYTDMDGPYLDVKIRRNYPKAHMIRWIKVTHDDFSAQLIQ